MPPRVYQTPMRGLSTEEKPKDTPASLPTTKEGRPQTPTSKKKDTANHVERRNETMTALIGGIPTPTNLGIPTSRIQPCPIARSISIRQPFADAILHSGKDIENRTWALPHATTNQSVILHAGKLPYIFPTPNGRDTELPTPTADRFGALLGYVTFAPHVRQSDSKWFDGPIGWPITEAIPFAHPVPYPGALGFFRVVFDDVECFPTLPLCRQYQCFPTSCIWMFTSGRRCWKPALAGVPHCPSHYRLFLGAHE